MPLTIPLLCAHADTPTRRSIPDRPAFAEIQGSRDDFVLFRTWPKLARKNPQKAKRRAHCGLLRVERSSSHDTRRTMRLLVTGGCEFIGSNFIRYGLERSQTEVITNLDALTYAGSLASTADFSHEFGDRYEFLR